MEFSFRTGPRQRRRQRKCGRHNGNGGPLAFTVALDADTDGGDTEGGDTGGGDTDRGVTGDVDFDDAATALAI